MTLQIGRHGWKMLLLLLLLLLFSFFLGSIAWSWVWEEHVIQIQREMRLIGASVGQQSVMAMRSGSKLVYGWFWEELPVDPLDLMHIHHIS